MYDEEMDLERALYPWLDQDVEPDGVWEAWVTGRDEDDGEDDDDGD